MTKLQINSNTAMKTENSNIIEDEIGKQNMDTKTDAKDKEEAYSYDEALELAGNGRYQIGLLVALSLNLLAMCIDLFSFSVVVTLCSCEFQLNITQKAILVSLPFIGPVITAYAWGYFSDTQGRRKSLLIGMSISFLAAVLCSVSPNWIAMAIFKLIGTCFCSGAQSATYALLGESCPERVKGKYMLVMTSIVHQGMVVYFTLGYFIAELGFSYDLGFITFVPWRLLVLVLALPLGLSALSIVFFYESPKFLLNRGCEDKALETLRNICRRNGRDMKKYLVQNVVLNEVGNLTHRDVSLLQSIWDQTVPLFKKPFLLKTMLLYYLIIVVYSTTGSLYIWLPFLTDSFTAGISSSSTNEQSSLGLCHMITQNSNSTSRSINCTSAVDLSMLIAVLISGTVNSTLNIIMAKLASWKKAQMIGILLWATFCSLMTTLIPNVYSGLFYFGTFSTTICMGPLFSYFVEMYPTSFRGMVACLGVMVARLSSVMGINIVGPFILSNCYVTFYGLTALFFSGVVMSFFLPSDHRKKEVTPKHIRS